MVGRRGLCPARIYLDGDGLLSAGEAHVSVAAIHGVFVDFPSSDNDRSGM